MLVEIISRTVASLTIWLPHLLLAGFLFLLFGLPFIALWRSPRSDITLIEVRLGGEGHRVISTLRNGSDWELTRRGANTWRKYDVMVQYPDGSQVLRTVGVSTSLLWTRSMVTYDGQGRRPLWARHQASLP